MRLRVEHTTSSDPEEDCYTIAVTVSMEAAHEAIPPKIQPHETATMYLVRVADWVGALPLHEQTLEVDGPPKRPYPAPPESE